MKSTKYKNTKISNLLKTSFEPCQFVKKIFKYSTDILFIIHHLKKVNFAPSLSFSLYLLQNNSVHKIEKVKEIYQKFAFYEDFLI